jgi:hypothetical protein
VVGATALVVGVDRFGSDYARMVSRLNAAQPGIGRLISARKRIGESRRAAGTKWGV